jgi:hypothetical protein
MGIFSIVQKEQIREMGNGSKHFIADDKNMTTMKEKLSSNLKEPTCTHISKDLQKDRVK